MDPVNGVEVPEPWIERAIERGLEQAELEEEVGSGLYYLTSEGGLLRRGFTTGTSAAAAAKAASLSAAGNDEASVDVRVPCGLEVEVPVYSVSEGTAAVVKDSGDHEDDVTNGAELVAEVKGRGGPSIEAGNGIGTATKTVGRLVEGEPAINPAPYAQIERAIGDVGNYRVKLSVTDGEKLAKKTRNEKLGVVGGISILGTTGLVEPWCEELRRSLESRAEGVEGAVVTTGRMGAMYSKMQFPERPVFVFGKNVGEGLHSVDGDAVLAGLPGLLLKWGGGELPSESGYSSWTGALNAGAEDLIRKASERTLGKAQEIKADSRLVVMDWSGDVIFDSGRRSGGET